MGQLREILNECLSRRGVLLFYNGGIFQHKVIQGFEGEDEIVIVSKEPMKHDVISGVEILSASDRKALRRN